MSEGPGRGDPSGDGAGVGGGFDVAHLQAVHRHLFDGVDPEAGRLRIVDPPTAPGPGTPDGEMVAVVAAPAYPDGRREGAGSVGPGRAAGPGGGHGGRGAGRAGPLLPACSLSPTMNRITGIYARVTQCHSAAYEACDRDHLSDSSDPPLRPETLCPDSSCLRAQSGVECRGQHGLRARPRPRRLLHPLRRTWCRCPSQAASRRGRSRMGSVPVRVVPSGLVVP
jgi:hypothetical protein